MARPGTQAIGLAILLLLGPCGSTARTEAVQVNTINDVLARLRRCWVPPPASLAHAGIDITVIVSFNHDGNILGQPRVTYESELATDNDRLRYRIAVMEALQRCTPMPFTDAMAGAVAGRPFAVRFRNPKPPLQPTEKRAWLPQKTL